MNPEPGRRPETPVVNVLMSVYNGEAHLPEALDTLLSQTFRAFEMVVVDDGSTDGSLRILQEHAERDDRIRLLCNESNRGLSASLNRGLLLCRAPIVARADADDIYAPNYLETQLRLLRDRPELGVVSSAFDKVDVDGNFLNSFRPPTEDAQIRAELLFSNCLTHSTTVFRAGLVRAAGGYDETFWTAQDYELWSRLRDSARFANSDVPLVRYRRHDGATTRRRGQAGERLSLTVTQRLLTKYLSRPLALDDICVVRKLYCGTEAPGIQAARQGTSILRDVVGQAGRVEDRATVTALRRRICRSLFSLAVSSAPTDRQTSRHLLGQAARMDPDWTLDRRMLKLRARLHLPEALLAYARDAMKGRTVEER
ncbi:MAG: glycosyltransferase [Gemmatimonadales bacterium]|nr:MAG: glycosyltransferase [Gemmatimonadales bacterium]